MSRFVCGLDHVQLAAPPGCEASARVFFGELIGLEEIEKPELLAARGGCWFRAGAQELHVGVEHHFVPALKAHPAFRLTSVEDLREVAQRLAAGGVEIAWADEREIPGLARFYTHDPWGNRLEFAAWRAEPERA